MRKLVPAAILTVLLLTSGCIESQSVSDISGADDKEAYALKNRAISIIRAGLADENSYVRRPSIEVAVTTERKELAPIIADLLTDDKLAVRYAAALALGDMKYTAGTMRLKRLLRDADPAAQMSAAYALTKLGNRQYSDMLRKAALSEDQTIRAKAVVLLGWLGDKRHLELLDQVLSNEDSSDTVKIQIAEAMANLGDRKILRTKLWPLLISKYGEDKLIGIGAMAALGTMEAKNAILTMLLDDILVVRLFAAGQLGRLGDTSGQEIVLEYLNSSQFDMSEWSVANETAVTAIGRIGTEPLKKFLPKLLNSRNKLIQLSAAQSVLLTAGDRY